MVEVIRTAVDLGVTFFDTMGVTLATVDAGREVVHPGVPRSMP
jgi:hypothetical protein